MLGLLSLRSWTTYELAQQMRRSLHYYWPRAESKIYEEPKKLATAGLATSQASFTGKRRSTVYEITDAGRDELRAWMADLIGEPVKEYPQFEAALCLLPVLPPDEALTLLRQRLTRIEAKATELERHSAHPAVQNLPPLFLVENEYQLALVKAEQRFIAELITRIENGWGPLELWRGFHRNREATMARLYREYGGGPMT